MPFSLPRPPKFLLPLTLYLIAFILILVLVVDYFLLPAADAVRSTQTNLKGAPHPTTLTAAAPGQLPHQPKEVRAIAAYARLLLTVVLVILFLALLLTFRTRRFFLPRDQAKKPTPTKYVDAWAESAKRLQPPPAPDNDNLDEAEPNG